MVKIIPLHLFDVAFYNFIHYSYIQIVLLIIYLVQKLVLYYTPRSVMDST